MALYIQVVIFFDFFDILLLSVIVLLFFFWYHDFDGFNINRPPRIPVVGCLAIASILEPRK